MCCRFASDSFGPPDGLETITGKKAESQLPSRWTMKTFTLVIRFY